MELTTSRQLRDNKGDGAVAILEPLWLSGLHVDSQARSHTSCWSTTRGSSDEKTRWHCQQNEHCDVEHCDGREPELPTASNIFFSARSSNWRQRRDHVYACCSWSLLVGSCRANVAGCYELKLSSTLESWTDVRSWVAHHVQNVWRWSRATLNCTEAFELDNIVYCLHSLVSEYTPRSYRMLLGPAVGGRRISGIHVSSLCEMRTSDLRQNGCDGDLGRRTSTSSCSWDIRGKSKGSVEPNLKSRAWTTHNYFSSLKTPSDEQVQHRQACHTGSTKMSFLEQPSCSLDRSLRPRLWSIIPSLQEISGSKHFPWSSFYALASPDLFLQLCLNNSLAFDVPVHVLEPAKIKKLKDASGFSTACKENAQTTMNLSGDLQQQLPNSPH
jgi:hypothetical protein